MELKILENFGLSAGEIKVYLALLELGSTQVGQIIEKSGLVSSAVHRHLQRLLERGFVSYIKVGKIKQYQAAPPKEILHFIDEQRKEFIEVLPELEVKQKFAKEKQQAEIFVGIRGIMAMLNTIIDESKAGDDYFFFATNIEERNEEIQEFFTRYDIKRKERGLHIRGLAPKSVKHLFAGRSALKMKFPDFPIPSDITVCDDKVALIAWEDKPVGYLIRSKQIYTIYRKFFEDIWNKTK